MADETPPKSTLDAWLDADDAKTQTRVVDLGKPLVTAADVDLEPQAPAPVETPPEPPPAEVVPEVTPTAETVEDPEGDEPPETPEAEAAGEPEIVGVAVAGETKPPTRPRWKDVREADKRAKESERRALEQERRALELERELAYARGRQEAQPPPAAPEVPEEDIDPITKLERETAALKNEIAQMRGQHAQTQVERTIVDQEMAFERSHPDYRQALKHFIESKREEANLTGQLDRIGSTLIQRNRQGVLDEAIRRGVSEQEAARELAFGVVVHNEREGIVEGARMIGRNVAEVIYDLATARGFKPPAGAAVVTPPVTPKPSQEAIREAAQSLSGVARSQTPPPPKAIRSRQDLLRMDPKELDAFIQQNDAETGNGWLESLG